MIENKEISLDAMYQIAYKKRKLFSLTIELNNTCNWNCIHCYIPCHSNMGLPTDKVMNILDHAREMGVFDIIFTGGEIFLRKDILEIIEHARRIGFRVSILSNASLIDKEIAFKIANLNISNFSATFFSMDENIHNNIAMNSKAYSSAVKGIRTLAKNGVEIELKTPILSMNSTEYQKVAKYAKKKGFSFTCSPIIFPKTDGCSKPVYLMMNDDEMVQKIEEIDHLMEYKDRELNIEEKACTVLSYSLFISSDGKVYPCGSFPIELGNIYNDSIDNIWNSEESQRIRSLRVKDLKECASCSLYSYCNCCPGIAYMESGNCVSCSGICKRIAKARSLTKNTKNE